MRSNPLNPQPNIALHGKRPRWWTPFVATSVLALAGMASPVMAADYYAAPTGSGSICSQVAPCTIQGAITAASANDTVHVAQGKYVWAGTLQVTGTGKNGLRIVGDNSPFAASSTPGNVSSAANASELNVATATGLRTGMIWINGAQDVVIENLLLQVSHGVSNEGIVTTGNVNGLVLRNNYLRINAGGGKPNAISLNMNMESTPVRDDQNSTGVGPYSAIWVTLEGNVVQPTSASAISSRAVVGDNVAGVFRDNQFAAKNQDVRLRNMNPTMRGSGLEADGNWIFGAGFWFMTPNDKTSPIHIHDNHFIAPGTPGYPSPLSASSLGDPDFSSLKLVGSTNPTIVENNEFKGYARFYRGLWVQNWANVTIRQNDFTPNTTYNGISTAILVGNKDVWNGVPDPRPFAVSILKNTFAAGFTNANSRAVVFVDDNDKSGAATATSLIVGDGDEANANVFAAGLKWYIGLDEHTCNYSSLYSGLNCSYATFSGTSPTNSPLGAGIAYQSGSNGNTQGRPFKWDVSALGNRFAGKLVSEMTPTEYTAIAGKVFDKADNAALGIVNYGALPPITTGTVTFSPTSFAYDGVAHTIMASLQEDGTATCVVTPSAVTVVGPNPVSATCTNSFYNVTGTGTVTVTKGTGTVALAQTAFTYTGSAITLAPSMVQEPGASCTATPATVQDAGTHSISISCTGSNYDAAGSISVTVDKGATQIELAVSSFDYDNSNHALIARLAAEPGTTCAGVSPATVRTVGTHTVSVLACVGTNYTAPAATLSATVNGAQVVRRVKTGQPDAYFATVAAALADADTANGDTLELAPGVHAGPITLTKAVNLVGSQGYETSLVGPTNSPPVTITGGIVTANNVSGWTISGFNIHSATGNCIDVGYGNNNITIIENVIHSCGSHGIHVNGISDVENVTISNNDVHTFSTGTAGGRGIVVWNGIKTDVTIQNNHVHNELGGNGCCGIELQDGSATGAWILDNVVENVGDSGMSFIQLTSGSSRENRIAENTITNTGRFGIEIKVPNGSGALSGNGAILVEGNIIDGDGVKSLRDRAGIAVHRRGLTSGLVDVTRGVVVRNNNITGFRTNMAGHEGYGIVMEGEGSSVSGNTLSDNDVGLQLQQGNPNGTPPGDSDQNSVSDWFNRGNAVTTCVDVGSNSISSNGINQRSQALPAGAPMTGGHVTNVALPGQTWCSITAAVAAASNGDTIRVAAVTHAENVIVSRPVKIVGAGQASTTLVPALYNPDCNGAVPGSEGSMCSSGDASIVVLVNASSVEISDLTVDGINPNLPSHATDIAARNGIMSSTSIGGIANFKVHDTTVRNIWLRAIYSPSTGGTFDFSDNTVDNVKSDPASIGIFSFYGSGVVAGNTVSNAGDAIAANWSKGITFSGNTVSNSGGGIHTDNSGGSGGGGDIIQNNIISCGVANGYGIFTFATYADVTVQGNQVSACDVGLGAFAGRTDGQTPLATSHFLGNTVNGTVGGIGARFGTTSFSYGEHNNQVVMTNNVITGAGVGVQTQRDGGKSLSVAAHFNRITGNTVGWEDDGELGNGSNGISDFVNNWWGCNGGPLVGAGCDTATGTGGTANPWLVLGVSATPQVLTNPGDPSAILVDLTTNSNGASVGSAFADGTSIGLSTSKGSLSAAPVSTSSGQATATLTGHIAGYALITATLDNATAQTSVLVNNGGVAVTVNDAPATEPHQDGRATCAAPDFSTIQAAINAVPAGTEILVCPGVYAEDLSITKSVALLGPQVGVSAGVGGSRDGMVDTDEAVIVPATQDGTLAINSYGSFIASIEVDNVIVDGFTFDTDNPLLSVLLTIGSATPDVASGIYALGNGITLDNLVFRNVLGSALWGGDSVSTVYQGNHLANSRVLPMPLNATAFSRAIVLYYNFYADVTGNVIEEARTGIYTENQRRPVTDGSVQDISGNWIDASRIGIWHNLFTDNGSKTSISGNNIAAVDSATETRAWDGVWIESMGGTQELEVSNNIINGGAAWISPRQRIGYLLNNVTTTAPVSTRAISGGTVANVDVGVLATDATLYTGPVNDFLVEGVSFSNIGYSALYVEDTVEVAGSAKLTIGTGNNFGAAPRFLTLAGAAPQVAGELVSNVFVRSARTYHFGTPGTAACTPAACTIANAPINSGIAVATVGGTVTVEAGTFVQNVVVNKGVNLVGPHAGVHGDSNTLPNVRGTGEAIIAPVSGVALAISASNAKVRGLEFGPVTASYVVEIYLPPSTLTGVEFVNNRIVDFTSNSGNGGAVYVIGSSGTPATNGMVISGNLFEDLVNGPPADPIAGPFAMAVKVASNAAMQITDNVFRRVQSNAMQLSSIAGAAVTDNVIDAETATYTTNVGVQVTYGSDIAIERNSFNRTLQAFLFNLNSGNNVSFTCNLVTNSSYGVRGAVYGTSGAVQSPAVFHNALIGGTQVYNQFASAITVGSNWYGSGAATVLGTIDLADALGSDPTHGGAFDVANCGDNTPTEIVAYAGTSPQSAAVGTTFADLRARVQDALGGAVAGQPVSLAANVSGGGATAALGTLSGTTNYNGEVISTAVANSIAGSYDVDAQSNSLATVFALTNAQGTATVAVSSPTVTYDGNTHAVTVSTTPSGLEGDVQIVYMQGLTPVATCDATDIACGPVNAGAYTATASIVGNPNYAGSGTGTLTINRATTTIVFTPVSVAYNGSQHVVTAHLADETGMDCGVVTGSPVGPNAGSYSVSAAVCVGTNYEAPAASGSVVIDPQPTTIAFSYLVQAFDGSPKSVVATTSPTGVALAITYSGSPTPPSAMGSYAVAVAITDANYVLSSFTPNPAILQIVAGTGDIALVLNGPVDNVHVGETAQYAATMLANPTLHAGETFGYEVVLSKTGGSPLGISDIATMEVFYNNNWVDATSFFGVIPFQMIGGNLVYQFPDGIPGYPTGFPVEDPSWTWNFRFTFSTTGVYTTSAQLVDGVSKAPITPAVVASIATTVVDALPPTDIHLVLGGPAAPVEVGQWAEYTGTLIADPLLHVGERFFVKVTLGRNGGTMDEADLAGMQIFWPSAWVDGSTLGVTFDTDGAGNLVYLFPLPMEPAGFEITDEVWTWNFRFQFAQADIYTAVAEVIPAADAGNPTPQVFATAAVSTTVVNATPHLPDMALLLSGPLSDVELGTPAQYTGTMLAEPAQYAGRNFFVRVRLSKNGGTEMMTAADLAMMELHQGGGWQDATAALQPFLLQDGTDLVYLFPQPANAFSIVDAIWSWHFRFTYGDTGVFTAVADVVDAADIADVENVGDVSAAASLATASVSTTVIATPQIVIDLQGPVIGEVGQALRYTGALDANPLPSGSDNFFVAIRLSKNGGADAMTEADLAVMEISLDGGTTWTDYTGLLPLTQVGNFLTYDFPQPNMPGGFPITGPWSWDFRFTYADTGVYRAEAVVITADANRTPVSNTATVQTTILAQVPEIAIALQGPLSGIGVGDAAHYTGTLTANPLPNGSDEFIVRVRLGKNGGAVPMTATDLTSMAISADGITWDPAPQVLAEIYVDPSDSNYLLYDFPNPNAASFPITGPWTWHFQFTYGSVGTYSAQATVLRYPTEEVASNTASIATIVGLGNANIAIDPASLYAVFNTSPHAAAVTTTPSSLDYTVTYDNGSGASATAPTNAGVYTVVATIDAGQGYTGSTSATLVIAKAPATVTINAADLEQRVGSTHVVGVSTAPNGLATTVTYGGSASVPVAAGVYTVVATVTNPNYIGSASASLVVTDASDIALVLNGPVDPIHVGDNADYAATMLANPALHTGELYGYHVVLSKTSGDPLAVSDLATMEVFYGGVWVDVTTLFGGSIPFVLDPITHELSYDFPDGLPGYATGFPIIDPSWTWNVRFSFATAGVYTVSTTLTDGIGGADIVPTVAASVATVVLDALPASDLHLVLSGPSGSVETQEVVEYAATLLADHTLHAGERFNIALSLSKSGGAFLADIAEVQVFDGTFWHVYAPSVVFSEVAGTLKYVFPDPSGFPIATDSTQAHFRIVYATTGIYTLTGNVIDNADYANPAAYVYSTAAVSTTVVAQTPHLPDLMLLLNGPLSDVELGSTAEYTGTLLAEPAQYAGRNFFVRIRLSKNGGVDQMQASDLAMMELHDGMAWQDATAALQPFLLQDGNDLVYLFPRPTMDTGFPITSAVWSWNFRFTYGDTGVFTAEADVVDVADIADPDVVADVIAAASLANASVSTTVIVGNANIAIDPASLYAVFNTSPHAAAVTTTPSGLDYTVTYDNGSGASATAPTNAGVYTVVATIDAGQGYTGSTSATLVIAKAPGTVSFAPLAGAYGSVHVVTAQIVESGESCAVTGVPAQNAAPGNYTVAATCTSINYIASGSATYVVLAPTAAITATVAAPVGVVTMVPLPNADAKKSYYTWRTNGSVGENVRAHFSISTSSAAPLASDLVLEYFETMSSTWQPLPLSFDAGTHVWSGGFGPGTGFPLVDGATSQFRATFLRGGRYTTTASIVGISSTVYATSASIVTDVAHIGLTGAANVAGQVGVPVESSMTLSNTGTAALSSGLPGGNPIPAQPAPNNENVRGRFLLQWDGGALIPAPSIPGVSPDAEVEYFDGSSYQRITLRDQDSDGVLEGYFGSLINQGTPVPAGFMGANLFRTTIKNHIGTYTMTWQVIGITTDTVYAQAAPQIIGIDEGEAVAIEIVSGDGGEAIVGGNAYDAGDLTLRVVDEAGNPVAGAVLAVNVLPGGNGAGATLSVPAITDVNGRTSVTALSNTVAGGFEVNASLSNGATLAVPFALANLADVDPAQVQLAIVSGSGQTAQVGTGYGLPLTVKTTDRFGNVLEGIDVAYAVVPSTPSVTVANATDATDANGEADSGLVTANAVAGAVTVTAAADASACDPLSLDSLCQVGFTLTNTAGGAASVTLVSDAATAKVNTLAAYTLTATVEDADGNPVQGVSVTLIGPSSGAGVVPAVFAALSGAQGQVVHTFDANATAGQFDMQAVVSGVPSDNVTLTNTAGAAALLTMISGSGQSTAVDTAFGSPLVVKVTDASGNPVAGEIVGFTVPGTGASATPSATNATSGVDGLASITVIANNTTGSYNVSASATSFTAQVNFALTNSMGGVSITNIVWSDSLTVTTSYTGTAKTATATVGGGHTASFTYNGSAIAPTNAGSYLVIATVNDGNVSGTAQAMLTIAPATNGSHGLTLTGGTFTYDGAGHPATVGNPNGVLYTLSYNSGSAPVNAGSYAATLTVTDPNYNVAPLNASIVIGQATAQIVLTNLIHFYDGTLKQATAITIPAGLPVTVSYVPANPMTVGSYAVTAQISGQQNYADLTVNGSLQILAVSVAGWEISGASSFTGIAGELLSPGPVVRVFNGAGNGVAGIAVTFTPGANSGQVAQTTVSTDANGLAAAAWTLAPEAGTDSLTATVGLPGLNSLAFTATSTEEADLAISKTSTLMEISFNELATYTLVVTNAGPSNVAQADILDELPAGLNVATATWLCAGSGGAVCGAANGSGDVDVSAAIPVGGSVTVTLSATVLPNAAIGPLVNEALVNLASGTDAQQGNNADTYTLQVINRAPEIFKDGFEGDDVPLSGVRATAISLAWQQIGNTPVMVVEAIGASGDALAKVEALQVGESRWFRLRWNDAEGVEQATEWGALGAELELDMDADYLGIGAADGASAMRLFVPADDVRLNGLRTGAANLH